MPCMPRLTPLAAGVLRCSGSRAGWGKLLCLVSSLGLLMRAEKAPYSVLHSTKCPHKHRYVGKSAKYLNISVRGVLDVSKALSHI